MLKNYGFGGGGGNNPPDCPPVSSAVVVSSGAVSATESVVHEVIPNDDTIKNENKSIFFMILFIKNLT
ncbi:hypothetical protein [Flavobacterium sp. J49]|uniref:hypothetical protein n=1 Tax=Flavobacterium sp. J49 TaxID=2718534 RepID=UPI001E5C0928|nr:hypothetical protein [Flavobacterium sp. J49]